MYKKIKLIGVLCVCVAFVFGAAPKYNILYIVLDATRADVFGCYGGPAKTPNIDKLAKQGVLFEKAYSTASWTYPSSFALTTGFYCNSFPGDKVTADIAYRFIPDAVCLTTLWNIIPKNMVSYIENPIVKLNEHGVAVGTYNKFKKAMDTTISLNKQGYLFFAWFMGAHSPYSPKCISPQTRALLKKVPEPLDYYRNYEPWWNDIYVVDLPASAKKYKNKHWELWSENEIQVLYSLYISEIEEQDEKVGEILKKIELSPAKDTTYIILTADHGEAFGEHKILGHSGFFEEVIHVPFIMVGPQIPKNKRIAQRVSNIDIVPTIQDYLGVHDTLSVSGKSLRSLIQEETRRESPVFVDFPDGVKTVLIYKNTKYIFNQSDTVEYYNLNTDLQERNEQQLLKNKAGAQILIKYTQFMQQKIYNQNRFKKIFDKQLQTRASFFETLAVNLPLREEKNRRYIEKHKKEMIKNMKALGYVN